MSPAPTLLDVAVSPGPSRGAPQDKPAPLFTTRTARLLLASIPGLFALLAVIAIVTAGVRTNWRLPKFSALLGRETAVDDDWCAEHGVPESHCVECVSGCMPRGEEFGWCKTHGVPECPLCHPEVAQLIKPYQVTAEDLVRAERTLAFAKRAVNNSKCPTHKRRIQFASGEIVERLDIQVAPVREGRVTETVSANGEISFDPTRVARVSPRSTGMLWRMIRQAGENVQKGDLLALVESVDVGKAKTHFQQAWYDVVLKRQNLEKVRDISGGVVPPSREFQAQADLEDAQVRLLAARQTLVNLGMGTHLEDLTNLEPSEVTARLQFLGIPTELSSELQATTSSSNLLPVVAPLDGEILSRSGTTGETVDGSQVLFVIADTSRVWLTLNVRLEDAERVEPGQSVLFTHQGHTDWDVGRVIWVSPAADERTRTVPVRVELKNSEGRHHAQTFGTARIVLREEPRALVVPSSAVHWDGDCHVVFVQDKNFDKPDAHKVFHVRKVRPGAKDVLGKGPVTEIAVGVLPGELLASTNSGILRSELLKNNLGAG